MLNLYVNDLFIVFLNTFLWNKKMCNLFFTPYVTWWNKKGRKYGAKSKEVREWMLSNTKYLTYNDFLLSLFSYLSKRP
jgi:hypothetical protein